MKNDPDAIAEDDFESYHVVPSGDLKTHVASENCWCNPTLEHDAESMLYIHNPLDRRDKRLN